MKKYISLILLLSFLFLTACSSNSKLNLVTLNINNGQDHLTNDVDADDHANNDDDNDAINEGTTSGDETLNLDLSTLPAGENIGAEYAGLLFSSSEVRQEGAWIVDSEGTARHLIDHGDGFVYNPETSQLAFLSPVYEEDIFILDLITGETIQLTDTPDLLEHNLTFLPGTDLLAFNYMPTDQLGPWTGYLGAVDLSTSEYLILDDQSSSYHRFVVSPKNGTILYDNAGIPQLYNTSDGTIDPLEMVDFTPRFSTYASPAFSADGEIMSFTAYGESDGEGGGVEHSLVTLEEAIEGSGVITYTVLHPYTSYGQRVGPDVVWSPDGSWIAIVTQGEMDAVENGVGLWMINPNSPTPDEYLIGMGTDPLWSPDGAALLYIAWGTGSYMEAMVMQVLPDFSTVQVPLPAGSFPFQWIDLNN